MIGTLNSVFSKQITPRIYLQNLKNTDHMPDGIRKIFLSNYSDEDKRLSSLSPRIVQLEIDKLVGEVENMEYRRNGSLLIMTKTAEQIRTLSKCTRLPLSNIAIKSSIAVSYTHLTLPTILLV